MPCGINLLSGFVGCEVPLRGRSGAAPRPVRVEPGQERHLWAAPPLGGTRWGSAPAGFWCTTGELLLSSGKVEILALSPLETGRVSISDEAGYFDVSPEELCTGPLFPWKTYSTKIEPPAFQKIYNYLSGINEKVVSLENIRTVFSVNKQMEFAVLILLITVVYSLIILFGRTAAITRADLCCSNSAGWMWLWSREFISASPLIRIGIGDVPQNKFLWILAGLVCAGICCPERFQLSDLQTPLWDKGCCWCYINLCQAFR